jgi:hypothetical protein
MDTATFKKLAHAGALTQLAIVRPAAASPREIHVQGRALPPDLLPVLEHDDGGGRRHWTSLAAAHAFARRHGFQGAIFVEEPRAS